MDYRRTVLVSLAVLLLTVFLPSTLIYLADPCHIFHRPLQHWLPHGFAPTPSCQLADSAEQFDSIILGTSLSENFRPEYLAQHTGMHRTLKLTMVGIVPHETHALARHALASSKIARVFWEISPHFFHMPDIRSFDDMEKKGRFPPYLYNRGRLDDYRYIFNKSTLSDSLDVLTGNTWNYGQAIDNINNYQPYGSKLYPQ